MSRTKDLFPFPNPVDEHVARTVAAGVVVIALVALVLQVEWLSIVLAVGFALRVAWGPRVSPLARLASRVIVPRLPLQPKMVPGPPKRFAQAIGLVVTTVAALLFYAAGSATAGSIFLGMIVVAATLESAFGLCLGCQAFAALMRAGVIPEDVCEACADITLRTAA